MNEAQATQALELAADSLKARVSNATVTVAAGSTAEAATSVMVVNEVMRLFNGALLRAILKMLPIDKIMVILEPLIRDQIGNDAIADIVIRIVRTILEQLKQGL